jgi:hypothetical protein
MIVLFMAVGANGGTKDKYQHWMSYCRVVRASNLESSDDEVES